MIEKYESKQVAVRRTAAEIYAALSDFANFTPLVEGRVDDWRVDGDECSFRVKGFPVTLRMVERVEPTLIKIEASDASPLGFTLWVQMVEARKADGEPSSSGCVSDRALPDTRLRLVVHAEMNVMVRMMIGARIGPALDSLADGIAAAFNA